MDLTLDAFSLYGIFCLTTLICILHLQIKAFRLCNVKFNLVAGVTYYGITIPIILIGSPLFFLIFIFKSESYYDKLLEILPELFLDSND